MPDDPAPLYARGMAFGRSIPAREWVVPAMLLGISVAAFLTALLGGDLVDNPVFTVAMVVSSYLVGARLRPVPGALTCLGAVTALTAANQLADAGRYSAANDFFFFAVLVGGVALAGELVTARATQVRDLRRLSAIRETQRAVEVQAARLEERNRIDAGITRSMMQRMGALVVQAAGVRREGTAGPARDGVARMEAAGRATLDDLRDVLGSLREPQDLPPEEPIATTTTAAPLDGVDVLVGLCGVPVAFECIASAAAQGPAWANALAGLAIGVPLVWRRRIPLTSAALSLALAAAMSALLTPLTLTVTPLLPLSLVGYSLGAHTRGIRRLPALVVLVLGTCAVGLASPADSQEQGSLVPTLIWLSLAFGAGVVAAQHAARAARLQDLVERIETGREYDVRLAVAEQRQAVARDLHDTVAHSMTIVCLHAEAAQQRWEDTDAVAASLDTIETSARRAMEQLRHGLDALQPEDALDDPEAEVRAFAATLGISPSVRAVATMNHDDWALTWRVVREALVNVSRYAPGSEVTVRIAPDADGAVVEVVNGPASSAIPGGGAFTGGSGTGLAGLAELLEQSRCSLEHGAVPGGGYRVAAYLPSASAVPA
jgi:signal transduction histidine kinase